MNTLTPLTPEQIAQYHDEGYVMLGRVLEPVTLENLREEELRFRNSPPPSPEDLTIFRSQVCHHSQIVRDFCIGGAHIALARQLVSDNLCFWYNQYVTKLPDAQSGKSEFPWHQDNGYQSIEPATNVTIWIALDDVDEENGCVWVLPRSHKNGLVDHSVKEGHWHLQVAAEGDGVPAVLKAGEAIAFNGLTLHRSKLNHTDRVRRAFFMEYADANAMHISLDGSSEKGLRPVVESPQSWLVSGGLDWPPTVALSLT